MPNTSLFSVIGTALGFGIIHVLTGPDHLSALSTLSVGKPLKVAFGLGVRWGCGHSFGLLIVAIAFFAIGSTVADLDPITYWADLFVGFFMLILGLWYAMKAWRERIKYLQMKENKEVANLLKENANTNSINQQTVQDMKQLININGNNNFNNKQRNGLIEDDDDDMHDIDDENEAIELALRKNDNKNDNNNGGHHHSRRESESKSKDDSINKEINDDIGGDEPSLGKPEKNERKSSSSSSSTQHANDESDGADQQNSESQKLTYQNDDMIPDDDMIVDVMNDSSVNILFDKEETRKTKCITRLFAFVAGIFHGVAGPGGVLGVLVALKLNDWFLSSLYLFLFFVSSILTMGVYAIVYGYATAKLTICADNKEKCAFILKVVSAIFSLIVGVIWITLTFTGVLDKIFD